MRASQSLFVLLSLLPHLYTADPTPAPSSSPSSSPTSSPTTSPTAAPITPPTDAPTAAPTAPTTTMAPTSTIPPTPAPPTPSLSNITLPERFKIQLFSGNFSHPGFLAYSYMSSALYVGSMKPLNNNSLPPTPSPTLFPTASPTLAPTTSTDTAYPTAPPTLPPSTLPPSPTPPPTPSPATSPSLYAAFDLDKDNYYETIYVLMPNVTVQGLQFVRGDLFVAFSDRVVVYRNVDTVNYTDPIPPIPDLLFTLNTSLPDLTTTSIGTMTVGPDGLIYISVNSPCNTPLDDPTGTCACILRWDAQACLLSDACTACNNPNGTMYPGPMEFISQIISFTQNATNITTVAYGVRKSTGIAFHPSSKDLWFLDNGRENWFPGGQRRPADEVNRIPVASLDPNLPTLHYGFPFCYGRTAVDDSFNYDGDCASYTAAQGELSSHVNPLSIKFYNSSNNRTGFPAKYQSGVFVAEGGSIGRFPPVGYRIAFLSFADDKATVLTYESFASGWLNPNSTTVGQDGEGDNWGHISDLLVLGDGSMLVANEKTGEVYRISYSAVQPTPPPAAKKLNVGVAFVVALGLALLTLPFFTDCFRTYRRDPSVKTTEDMIEQQQQFLPR